MIASAKPRSGGRQQGCRLEFRHHLLVSSGPLLLQCSCADPRSTRQPSMPAQACQHKRCLTLIGQWHPLSGLALLNAGSGWTTRCSQHSAARGSDARGTSSLGPCAAACAAGRTPAPCPPECTCAASSSPSVEQLPGQLNCTASASDWTGARPRAGWPGSVGHAWDGAEHWARVQHSASL